MVNSPEYSADTEILKKTNKVGDESKMLAGKTFTPHLSCSSTPAKPLKGAISQRHRSLLGPYSLLPSQQKMVSLRSLACKIALEERFQVTTATTTLERIFHCTVPLLI